MSDPKPATVSLPEGPCAGPQPAWHAARPREVAADRRPAFAEAHRDAPKPLPIAGGHRACGHHHAEGGSLVLAMEGGRVQAAMAAVRAQRWKPRQGLAWTEERIKKKVKTGTEGPGGSDASDCMGPRSIGRKRSAFATYVLVEPTTNQPFAGFGPPARLYLANGTFCRNPERSFCQSLIYQRCC